MFWRTKRRLGINDPALDPQPSERIRKYVGIIQRADSAKKAQPPICVRRLEPFEEQPPEQAGEHMDGQKEVLRGGYPALPTRRQRSARNQTMDMRMVGECLPSCTKYGN